MNTDGFWKGTAAAFIAFMIIMFIIIIIISCVLCYRPMLQTDYQARLQYMVIKILITALDIYSTIFFWFIFAITGYWFIFYKM